MGLGSVFPKPSLGVTTNNTEWIITIEAAGTARIPNFEDRLATFRALLTRVHGTVTAPTGQRVIATLPLDDPTAAGAIANAVPIVDTALAGAAFSKWTIVRVEAIVAEER